MRGRKHRRSPGTRTYQVEILTYSAGELRRMLEGAGFAVKQIICTEGGVYGEFGTVPARFAVVAQKP